MGVWSQRLVFLAVILRLAPVEPQPGAPAVDPCSLVPGAEVERIIGKLAKPPKSQTNERVRTCEYTFANSNLSLEIWVFPVNGLERARQSFKDITPVTDIGAEAFVRRNKDIDWLELYSRKGSVTFEVTMKNTPGDLEKTKELARKVLSAL